MIRPKPSALIIDPESRAEVSSGAVQSGDEIVGSQEARGGAHQASIADDRERRDRAHREPRRELGLLIDVDLREPVLRA
jgi:hypothetical protein